MSKIITVNCPVCKKVVIWKEMNTFRPFCSQRCQLIDLYQWTAETEEECMKTSDFHFHKSG